MRQLVYLGPRKMELQEALEPTPGPGEVVFETEAAAVCGSDLHGFREASPRRIPPLVMGHDALSAKLRVQMRAELKAPAPPAVGQAVRLGVPPGSAYLFDAATGRALG